ncbi:MAG TPA: helix-turn-helix domain-containing protein [Kofleriaceae bacterium]|nr:helix-turn-helix domain-containing protein [Kofleriaceae bacterium]
MNARREALVREMLGRVGDKWTLLVIDALVDAGELRFSRLRDAIGGISQKMLTKTLRELERDGLVTRRVHPTVPPRVDYKLTRLGEQLGESVCGIWEWVDEHLAAVERARRAYDARRHGASSDV